MHLDGNAMQGKKNIFETFLKLTFAVTEFFRTLRPECHRGGTNQPPKCTQQHHYHFTADIMFTGMCFVTVLFVPACLTERVALLPFGVLTFRQARRIMKDHLCKLKNLS